MNHFAFEHAQSIDAQQPIEAFSFDVFDTFLLRRCTAPDGVFERAFQLAPVKVAGQGWARTFVQHRRIAEMRARKSAVEKTGRNEVSIDEIYAFFPVHLFGIGPDLRPALAHAEFEAECDLCFTNAEMRAMYGALRHSGIKTGFISDTYWSGGQLATLLRRCSPDLVWDFLYASCDHGVGKSGGLFDRYLSDIAIEPAKVSHVGDNPHADILPARRLGMRAAHYPQATEPLAAVFQRESHVFEWMCTGYGESPRLDGGLRTLRRRVAGLLPESTPYFTVGATVVGPVMAAFDRFIADRVRRIEAVAGNVKVVFLARDGLLPLEIWKRTGRGPAHYIEVNRRVSLVAGVKDLDSLCHFFDAAPLVTREAIDSFFKTSIAAVSRYFAGKPGGIVTGERFAEDLPTLVSRNDLRRISRIAGDRLMAYLREAIPDLENCTDLVLVDLGYSGTAQKGLREVLDRAGLPIRLHGLYLATVDESFAELLDGDSAEGFISDAVIPVQAKRQILGNIALIEQICGAPEGSVKDYVDGRVVREPDPRDPVQLEICAQVREGVHHFVERYGDLVGAGWPDPLAAARHGAEWAAAMLARFLLLPTDDELALFRHVKLDANLGSQAQIPLIDGGAARNLIAARPLPSAFKPVSHVMWPAGSMTAVSPVCGFLNTLLGLEALPGDIFGDAKCGDVDAILVSRRDPRSVKLSCLRTGWGEARVRIPLITAEECTAILLPLAGIAPEGLIRGIALQIGDSAAGAAVDANPRSLPMEQVKGHGLALMGAYYQATAEDPHLAIPIPVVAASYAILTVTIALGGGNRLLALSEELAAAG